MKLKKLLISASAIAASSGLLATVLTSCAKSNIDDDQKIVLDDEGKFVDEILAEGTADFQKAAANALKHASTWKAFKEALANEIIYKWYENRATSDKNPNRNDNFKTFLENKKFRIDDDYNNKVDSYKSKYGANHQFYLQNEVLSPNGGTVDAYKHSQLVNQVKDEFIDNVFRFNYFSMASDESPSADYPHIFTPAETSDFNPERLNNPTNWKDIGFFAKANKSFPVVKADIETDEGLNKLAEYPDGDYAIIQNYVFNRWFETEKPFFSAAALFKYNKPATVGSAMTDIYSNKATVPDTPNEAFPFFGTASSQPEPSNGFTGQRAFYRWYKAFNKGDFTLQGIYSTGIAEKPKAYNGSISIPAEYTEDSQTLLLSYASRMIDSTDKALYTPYAIAAASLYRQMLGITSTNVLNTLTQTYLANSVMPSTEPLPDNEDPIILKLFFFQDVTAVPTITSYLDLSKIYDATGTDGYHCSLFKENKDFPFFYGDTSTAVTNHDGIKFVTNNVQIPLDPTLEGSEITYDIDPQPWVFELNEAGMHVQTIDGYTQVIKASGYRNREKALKEALMYRLLQHQAGWDGGIVSANVFGSDSGDLYEYFKKNYADIVLEIAFAQDKELNVFRDIASYKQKTVTDPKQIFFNNVCEEQKFYHASDDQNWKAVRNYIKATQEADLRKSIFDNAVSSSKKIYAYRATQISNSKLDKGSNKVYENGLLAPLAVEYDATAAADFDTARYYRQCMTFVQALYFNVEGTQQEIDTPTITNEYTKGKIKTVFADTTFDNLDFISHIADVTKDKTDEAFSAQIASAKAVQSNRYWYLSPVVDKTMYSFLDSNALANEVKGTTYSRYSNSVLGEGVLQQIETSAAEQITSVYKAKKLLSSETNLAYYTPKDTSTFFSVIDDAYTRYNDTKTINDGKYNDEWLNFKMFEATLSYLIKDTNNDGKFFDNFYNSLESSIKDGERAYVGYITKYNTYDPFQADLDKVSTITDNHNPYVWTMDVANIFDDFHYAGNPGAITQAKLKGDFEQYWNVIRKQFNDSSTTPTIQTLGGFVGIQTPNDNDLDKDSGLQDAAFGAGARPFSHHVYQTESVDNPGKVAENTGVWYPWAGTGETDEVVEETDNPYYFEAVEDPRGEGEPIEFEDFNEFAIARKLACKFAKLTSPEDIRALAGKIGKELHNQDNDFTKIASGETPYLNPDTAASEMKYDILTYLQNKTEYESAFQRLENVELRRGMYDGFCFEKSPNEGYKFMCTQVNLADVKERKMSPETLDNLTMPTDAPITLEEFWYILADFATVNSVQQNAMKDAINEVFEGKKLVVHDAQLYNKFDATWIKDWVKKPMGE